MASKNGIHAGRKRTSEEASRGDTQPGDRPALRVEPAAEGSGPCVRIVLEKLAEGHPGCDVTRALTAVLAHAIWTERAGDDAQNWIDAERLLEGLCGAARPRRAERREQGPAEEVVRGPLPDTEVLGRLRRRTRITKT